MARMRTDSDRAALLSALLDQQGGTEEQAPNGPSDMPMQPGASESPTVPPEGLPPGQQGDMPAPMPPQAGRGIPQQLQPVPGQPGMVAVPQQVVSAIMQQLMQQGSANSIGRANGSDGSNRPPRIPMEEEEDA